MMNDGDEYGKGSEWHIAALAALADPPETPSHYQQLGRKWIKMPF